VYKNHFIAVVRSEGCIMRDVNGVVRLPFGSEYSIRLNNKDSRTAVAKVEIDGEDVMGGHRYIVPGNSTCELEGFLKGLNATHKFRFIKKNKEISRFRGDRIDDGIIRVEFWYEQVAYVMPYIKPYFPPYKTYDDDTRFGKSTGGWDYTSGDTGFYSLNNCTKDTISCFNHISTPISDEGITVKGSKANQNFQYGNVGVLETQSSVIIIRLKGEVERKGKIKSIKKPVTVRTRIQCSTCGRKWKSYLKFCGNCSTALD
jgi:hypothetical protein